VTTIALEGHGVSVSFSASGFTGDLLNIVLSERARETIETVHLGTQSAKTYKPGETVDLGMLTMVVDHDPAALQLVGYPAETITIIYPLQPGQIIPDSLSLFGCVMSQGTEEMKMDQRLVTKLQIKLANYQSIPGNYATESPIVEVLSGAELFGFDTFSISESENIFRTTDHFFTSFTVS
jgi:hypothetical protein